MRISDWSSDVCSSDLHGAQEFHPAAVRPPRRAPQCCRFIVHGAQRHARAHVGGNEGAEQAAQRMSTVLGRSEEHTSELQSLMRISYAVFCLQKKNKSITIIGIPITDDIPPQTH